MNRKLTVNDLFWPGIFFLALWLQCTIKKPVSPTWDVLFEVPLADKTYTMIDLDKHSNNIDIDQGRQEVVLEIDADVGPFPVGKFLTAKLAWDQSLIDFSGSGFIGAQKALAGTIVLEDDILVEEAVFDSGVVVIEVHNHTNFWMNLNGIIESLNVNDPSLPVGQPFPEIQLTGIPPGNSFHSISLQNVRFHPIRSGELNLVPYTGTLTLTAGSSGPNNAVDLRIDLSGIRYQRVVGWLNQTRVEVADTFDTDIANSSKLKALYLQSAQMTFTLINDVHFPASLEAVVSATGDEGQVVTVPVQGSIAAAATTAVGPIEVAPLFNLWPSTMEIHGEAVLGDGSTKAEVSKTDSLRAHLYVRVPLIFSIQDTAVETDVDTAFLSEDFRERLKRNAMSARLVFEVENHLPAGFLLEACFSRTRGDSTLFRNYELRRFLELPVPSLSGDPGSVQSPGTTEFSFDLSRDEILVFDAAEVYWGLRLLFAGTNGMVKVLPDDYIRIRTHLDAYIRADFQEDETPSGGLP